MTEFPAQVAAGMKIVSVGPEHFVVYDYQAIRWHGGRPAWTAALGTSSVLAQSN